MHAEQSSHNRRQSPHAQSAVRIRCIKRKMYHKGVSVALAATAPCCHHGQQSPSGVKTPKQIDRKPSANHPGGVPCHITRHATPRGLHRQRRSRVQRSAGQLQARSTVTHQPSSVRLSCGNAGKLHQLLCLHKTTLPNNDGPPLSCSLYTCMDQRDKGNLHL